jgi:hypothetical protein
MGKDWAECVTSMAHAAPSVAVDHFSVYEPGSSNCHFETQDVKSSTWTA